MRTMRKTFIGNGSINTSNSNSITNNFNNTIDDNSNSNNGVVV